MTAAPLSAVRRENWAAQLVRSRLASVAALGIVAAAAMLPPNGFGVPLCQFRALTQLPCMGCGLTRCFIGMAHLRFQSAFFYHPVGALAFPLVVFIAALLVIPPARRDRAANWVAGHGNVLVRLGILYASLFVTYGLGRMVWVWLSGKPSPW